MSLQLKDARKLLQFLLAEHAKPKGLTKLEDRIDRAIKDKLCSEADRVGERAMRRILKDAAIPGATPDGHGSKYSAERLTRSIRPTLFSLYRFASSINFRTDIDESDFFGRLDDFFRTGDDQYSDDDFVRLEGIYRMYRRCWFDSPSHKFMQSWVTIRGNDISRRFNFTERQNFPEHSFRETSSGHLFSSGRAIVAVCRSPAKDVVKFLSISGLVPERSRDYDPVECFSGNGIATSDRPPHTGYGFYCERVTEGEAEEAKGNYPCSLYPFDEFRSNKFDIFRKIVEYERFESVDLVPKVEIERKGVL